MMLRASTMWGGFLLVTAAVLLVCVPADADALSSCRTPSGQSGQCITLQNCESLARLSKSGYSSTAAEKKLLSDSACDSEMNQNKVCCPTSVAERSSPSSDQDRDDASATDPKEGEGEAVGDRGLFSNLAGLFGRPGRRPSLTSPFDTPTNFFPNSGEFTTRRPFASSGFGNDFTTRRPFGGSSGLNFGNDFTTRRPFGSGSNSDFTTRRPFGSGSNSDFTTRRPFGSGSNSDFTTRRPFGGSSGLNFGNDFTTRRPFGSGFNSDFTTRRPSGSGFNSDFTTQRPSGSGFNSDFTTRRPSSGGDRTTRRPQQQQGGRVSVINPEECGVTSNDRIVGGNSTVVMELPWMVRLGYGNRRISYRCGGSLINSRYVLTAAHCVGGKDNPTQVRLGEHDEDSTEDCSNVAGERLCAPPVVDVPVEKVIRHPEFSDDSNSPNYLKNDIALLRLKTEVRFTEAVKPICLAGSSENLDGKKAAVAGWGKDKNGRSSGTRFLMKANLPMSTFTDCQRVYRQRGIDLDEGSQICAGGRRGVDSCQGDSGGPLYRPGEVAGLSGPRIAQVGVVSFGLQNCAVEGVPGVYTKVSNYVPWIVSNMRA